MFRCRDARLSKTCKNAPSMASMQHRKQITFITLRFAVNTPTKLFPASYVIVSPFLTLALSGRMKEGGPSTC